MPTDQYETLNRDELTKLVMHRAGILCRVQPEANLRDTLRVLDGDSMVAAVLKIEAEAAAQKPATVSLRKGKL